MLFLFCTDESPLESIKYKLSCITFACFELSIFCMNVLKSKWYSLSSLLDNGAGELDYKGINQSKNPDDILGFTTVKPEWFIRLSLQKDW